MLRRITQDVGRFRAGQSFDYPIPTWMQIARSAGRDLHEFSALSIDMPSSGIVHQEPKEPEPVKRKRGRPKGSRNKLKGKPRHGKTAIRRNSPGASSDSDGSGIGDKRMGGKDDDSFGFGDAGGVDDDSQQRFTDPSGSGSGSESAAENRSSNDSER